MERCEHYTLDCQAEKMGCKGCGYYKKSADELFEDLGYKKQEGLREINYYRGNDEIVIYKDLKWFSCSKQEEIDFINMQELQAINKKVEELGWI